jgi:hypothetical protein
LITSPDVVVPDMVAVVVLLAVCWIVPGCVRSLAKHVHPCDAVSPGVITTVHTPAVPDVKVPALAPPTSVATEQPEAVNVVPVTACADAFHIP